MAKTPDQSSGSKTGTPLGRPEQRDERREGWRPRVVQDHSFNVFETDHQGPDTVPPDSKIQDPTEETTPLEGTRDHSREDSMEPDYVASEPSEPSDADEADRDRRLGSPDRHTNTTPGTSSDPARPNDRTTLGR